MPMTGFQWLLSCNGSHPPFWDSTILLPTVSGTGCVPGIGSSPQQTERFQSVFLGVLESGCQMSGIVVLMRFV